MLAGRLGHRIRLLLHLAARAARLALGLGILRGGGLERLWRHGLLRQRQRLRLGQPVVQELGARGALLLAVGIGHFLAGHQAQRDVGAVDVRPPRGGAVTEHLFGHGVPLVALAVAPSLGLDQLPRNPRPFEAAAIHRRGPRAPAVVVAGQAVVLVAQLVLEQVAGPRVDEAGNQLRAQRGAAVDHVHVLHRLQYVDPEAVGQVDGDHAIADGVGVLLPARAVLVVHPLAVGVRHHRRGGQHCRHLRGDGEGVHGDERARVHEVHVGQVQRGALGLLRHALLGGRRRGVGNVLLLHGVVGLGLGVHGVILGGGGAGLNQGMFATSATAQPGNRSSVASPLE